MERWRRGEDMGREQRGRKRTAEREVTTEKRKQPKITMFITGCTQKPPYPKKKRPRPEVRRKVTRNELLVEILQITKIENIVKREESDRKWGPSEIKQYGEKKKKAREDTAAKGRATQGWMMKGTVAKLRKMGRKNKMEAKDIDEKIGEIIEATVILSKELHEKSIHNNRQRRREEGLQLKFARNNKNNFKAIMNMKRKEDSTGIG
jgi:hypothetical protein